MTRGDFFDSVHVDDAAPELEDWIARTRARLKRRASTAAWSAADVAAAAAQSDRALELGHRACELDPDAEAGWRRLITLHDQLGDRAGALRTYEELAARLEREFDVKPAAETGQLAMRIRTAQQSVSSDVSGRAAAPGLGPSAAPTAAPAAPAQRRSLRPALVGAAIAVLAVAGGLGGYLYKRLSEPTVGPSLVAAGSLASRGSGGRCGLRRSRGRQLASRRDH